MGWWIEDITGAKLKKGGGEEGDGKEGDGRGGEGGREGGEKQIGLFGRFNPDRDWGRNIWRYPEEGDLANSWSS